MISRHACRFILLMFMVGLNLRPAMSSVAPLLSRLQENAGLSASAAGLLTTLPVLFLGLTAPLAPMIGNRIGSERALSAALLLLASGLLLRVLPFPGLLYLGTAMAGSAIGLAGTLLPALVKRELPQNADLLTGLYTMALCLGGALGAGLSVPLMQWLGNWQASLVSWSLLALATLIVWISYAPSPAPKPTLNLPTGIPLVSLLRQPLTWQVMLFMGIQSSMAYIVFGWLPTLLIERGYSEATAGWTMAVSIMCQLVSALSAPWIARLHHDQRPALLLVLVCTALGLVMLLAAPLAWRWPGAVLLGLGQGGSFSLALSLLVLRTANERLAGQLSGLVQGGGYTLAALGPFGVGLMLQAGATTQHIAWLLIGLIGVCCGFAFFAGRKRQLDDQSGQLQVYHR
ncbi:MULTISPECIES: MFS transporter [Halomonadaceae]|jgi:CP family cyanate transporter-like MFS transporter|uniref:MFS transporter n=2 Tax=Vreelandella TaxID=3137766 RepID=A0A0D7V0F9_9GAMM|nr:MULTISPECIES: MFS transporter [Halomonas]KTG25546.1 MFS transporter [Idiomarina sp. H105]MEC9020416.1 MFS transporter [Pseudomonadota bacterium]OAE96172.1 MFS transporter [Idiomarina sp. WRN-38]KJD20335.1 MFS transporter [Halomonas meridiana]MAD22015.1 MFS transporter [Halomonas sp.]